MTLAAAVAFVDEIHLDVAELWALSQVILAHQAVEIDRRRSARIDLVVTHFRNPLDDVRELIEQTSSRLDGRTLRELGNDLEFRLVVEGEHLQHDELHHHEADRHSDGAEDSPIELVPARASRSAGEKGTYD